MAVQNFVDEALRILDASVRTLIDSEHSNDVLDAEETRLSALYRNVQRLSTAQPEIEDFGQIIHKILIDIQTKKEYVQVLAFKKKFASLYAFLGHSCTMPVADPGGGGAGGIPAPPPPRIGCECPKKKISELYVR